MKKLLLLFLVILLSTMTSGCLDMIFGPVEDEGLPKNSNEQHGNQHQDPELNDENSWELVFYCIDKSTNLLVPITIAIPKKEGIARAVVEELVLGSSLSKRVAMYGFEMPLPQRTEVLGISIRDGTARVDLSDEILTFRNDRHEHLGITSLVFTLTQFPTIERVQLAVNGQILQTLIYDTYVKVPMDRSIGVNISVNDGVDLKETTKILVYFPIIREGQTYFVPETKVVNKTEDILGVALREFLRGPNTKLLTNNIPANVTVLEAEIKEKVATVNFSKELQEINTGTERAVIDALILTLMEINEVESVKILIDGAVIGENLSAPRFPKIP